MNFAVLVGLTVGAGLLGSLPAFASSTAAKALNASLSNAHPSVRNIQVNASPEILTSALNGFINESIGELVDERVSISHIQIEANATAPVIIDQQEINANLGVISVWSMDKLTRHAQLTYGDWPIVTYPQSQADALKPPTIQAAITEDVSSATGLSIGDLLQDRDNFKYLVTGIVHINDPESDIWWQDNTPFYITREPGVNEDINILPIFIHPQSMKEYLPGHTSEWRYILEPQKINIANAEVVEFKLTNLKNRLSASHAKMTTGLPNLIEEYRNNLTASRSVIYLLSSQAFLFVIFTLILMASMLVDNSRSELVIMTGRGAGRLQIITTFAIEVFILAAIAGLVLGPLLTKLGITLWGLIFEETVSASLQAETWSMSILAAGVGWLAVTLSIIPAARSNLLEYQQSFSRPGKSTLWQKSYVDIFMVVVGVLLFWQLSNSGSFVMRRFQGSSFTDPLLLIGPSLLLIALAMLYLRLFPVILSGIARIARTGRGILIPLGLTKVARNPQKLGWIVLLVSMASALILFARIYSEALYQAQEQIAKYQAGSDIRLDVNKLPATHLAAVAEHLPTSIVYRGRVQEGSGRGITILAVDPETFVKVSQYPPGMTNLTIDIIMRALDQPSEPNADTLPGNTNPYTDVQATTEPIPAIFSYSSIPNNGKIGDRRQLLMAGQPFTFEIRGIIADFPTLSSDFLIVNSRTFEEIIGKSVSTQLKQPEAWMSTKGYDHNQILAYPFIANSLLADSRKFLNLIRNNIITLGTVRAFGLNAFVLTAISLVGLILANYFSIRHRSYEFSILRAFGLSFRQSNLFLVGEGFLILILGLISGLILGYSLTRFMRPYLSLALSRSLPGMMVHQININWGSVVLIITLLTLSYGLATAMIILSLWKSNLQQSLRTSGE